MLLEGFEQVNGGQVTVIGLTHLELEALKTADNMLALDLKKVGIQGHIVLYTGITNLTVKEKYKNFLKNVKQNTKKKLEVQERKNV